jgi:hypothetical protein
MSVYSLAPGPDRRVDEQEPHKGREIAVGWRKVVFDHLSLAHALGGCRLSDPLSG